MESHSAANQIQYSQFFSGTGTYNKGQCLYFVLHWFRLMDLPPKIVPFVLESSRYVMFPTLRPAFVIADFAESRSEPTTAGTETVLISRTFTYIQSNRTAICQSTSCLWVCFDYLTFCNRIVINFFALSR